MKTSPLVLLSLLAMACEPTDPSKPDDTDTSEGDTDTDADGDTDADADADADTDADTDDCIDYAALVAGCLDEVVYVNGGGSYYNGIDVDDPNLAYDLHCLIDDHDHVSYDGLWDAFWHTDRRSDGKVWDIYSDIPGGSAPYSYTFDDDQCGQYGEEGDCYNREHSFPSSWFEDLSPMKSDLHQVFPVDGYMNSIRSSHPFGDVGYSTYESANGTLRGNSDLCSYGGRVFEPIDDFKGDVARAQLYMSIRYRGEDGGWSSSEATDGAVLEDWYLETMIAWHLLDPVSSKEQDRNDEIQDIQHNRNPFVDHPEYACWLWVD
jgi:endonuclease I